MVRAACLCALISQEWVVHITNTWLFNSFSVFIIPWRQKSVTDVAVWSTVILSSHLQIQRSFSYPIHLFFNIEYLQDMKYCIALLMLFQFKKNIQVCLGVEKIRYLHFGKLCWIREWHFSQEGEQQHQKFYGTSCLSRSCYLDRLNKWK